MKKPWIIILPHKMFNVSVNHGPSGKWLIHNEKFSCVNKQELTRIIVDYINQNYAGVKAYEISISITQAEGPEFYAAMYSHIQA